MDFTKNQVAAIARLLAPTAGGYMKALDQIATIVGHRGNAGLMAGFAAEEAKAAGNASPEPIFTGELADWRSDDALDADDAPIGKAVSLTIDREGDHAFDIYVGGAEKSYYGFGASSIRVEREADATRFMIYDACCEAPRVFAVKDGMPLTEAANDWEPMDWIPEDDTPETDQPG